MAGGTPIEFGTIGVCDGIAMNHTGMKYSLASREIIADSVETMLRAHCFDGMICVPNCDKIIPGMLMAAVRVNIPTIFVSGGPMAAGKTKDGRKVDLISIFEGVAEFNAGKITEAELNELETTGCPTQGSCSGMFTANSMNCLNEAIGLALPGNGTIVATHKNRVGLFEQAAARIVETAEAWQIAVASETTPTLLCLSRQGLPAVRRAHSGANLTACGAYVLHEPAGERDVTLIATGGCAPDTLIREDYVTVTLPGVEAALDRKSVV